MLQLWEKEIKAQQMAVKTSRRNLSNPENQTGSAWLEGLEGITLEGEHTIADVHKPLVDRDQYHTIGRTIFDQSGQLSVPESSSEVIGHFVRDQSLNEQQWHFCMFLNSIWPIKADLLLEVTMHCICS